MTPKAKRIAFLTEWIAGKRKEISALGSGVRSSADSCDEALALSSIREAQAEIEVLQDLSDDTARVETLTAGTVEDLHRRVAYTVESAAYSGHVPCRETFTHIKGQHRATIQFREASNVGSI